ncbi:unnamed protein product, partial [Heterosigma akashiwo]
REKLRKLDTTSICDAAKNNGLGERVQVLSHQIRPRHQMFKGIKLIGPAFTLCAEDDFLTVVEALNMSKEGDVLVINTRESIKAVAGEIFVTEAHRRKLGGIICEGSVRDSSNLHEIGFPVYSRFLNPYAGTFHVLDSLNEPTQVGGCIVCPGDLMFGDDDGVLNMGNKAEEIDFLMEQAGLIKEREIAIMKKMKEDNLSLSRILNET